MGVVLVPGAPVGASVGVTVTVVVLSGPGTVVVTVVVGGETMASRLPSRAATTVATAPISALTRAPMIVTSNG